MKQSECTPGLLVRIRDWDDMKAEFGQSGSAIPVRCGFYAHMRHLCGKTAEVAVVRNGVVTFKDWNGDGWSISTDMLEPVYTDHALGPAPDISALF